MILETIAAVQLVTAGAVYANHQDIVHNKTQIENNQKIIKSSLSKIKTNQEAIITLLKNKKEK